MVDLVFFDPSTQKFATSLTQTESEWPVINYFSSVCSTDDGNVFVGLNDNSAHTLRTSPLSPQYQSSTGDAYIVRFQGNSVAWDTYYGETTDIAPAWTKSGPWSNLIYLAGRGNLAYNSTRSTLFAGMSAMGESVETQSKPGYFFQDVNSSSTGAHVGIDVSIAAFTHNSSNSDWFSWGTIFGGYESGGTIGLANQKGDDYLGGLVTYNVGSESYLTMVGSSLSQVGVPWSQENYYPTASLISPANPDSWYRKDNYSTGPYNSDIVISRFKVSDIEDGINISEQPYDNFSVQVFPNPSVTNISIKCQERIESVKLYSLNGNCVLEKNFYDNNTGVVQLEVSKLSAGLYVIEVNGLNYEKFVKN